MSEMELLLEAVAREYLTSGPKTGGLAVQLKRRLLPLLEAGEAMDKAIRGGYTDEADLASDSWIAAKKAALEGK